MDIRRCAHSGEGQGRSSRGTLAVAAEGLGRSFGTTVAVRDLTLRVYAGEVFGLLGHNGAGKTTTIRLLNGVLAPSSGSVRVLGLSPSAEGTLLRARTGVLTETPALDERLSARENLSVFADLYGVPVPYMRARVRELLDTFELADRADERLSGYSKGMKQRLALARCLLHRPELLFLDEPTAGLDPVASQHVHEMIFRMAEEGRTVFLCTHNLTEAQRLCDRVAVLEHGRVVAEGTVEELASRVGHRQRVEIEVEPAYVPAALEGIRRAFPRAECSVGHRGDISLDGIARDEVPVLLSALVDAAVPVYRLAPQEASLEDVYFALQGEEMEA